MLRTSAAAAGLAALLAAQTPQFVPALLPGLQYPLATDVAFGDLDGDGDLDLFVVSAFGGALLRNDGGSYTSVTATLPPLPANQRTAAFVHVDADDRADLLLTWTGQARLFRSLPGGAWQEITANLPAGMPTIHGAVAADVDGDGDEDLVCAGNLLDGGQNQLLTNDGSGGFSRSTPFPGNSFQPLVADVDGDGDLDVFFVRGTLALCRNDGGGVFTDVSAAALPGGLGSPTAMALGDVDGDGDVDVFVGGSPSDQILDNDGAGTFALRPGALPAPLGATQTTALADVDCDGFPDVCRGTANYGMPTLARNDGTGVFHYAQGRLPPLNALAAQVRAADLDSDGDPDLVITGLGVPPQVLWNGHRQLSLASPPVLGGQLAYELSAEPGYGTTARLGLLAVCLFRLPGRLDVPPWGWLEIDPTGPTVVVPIAFQPGDAPQGAAFPVPMAPSIVGLPLYAQGFVDAWPDAAATRLTALVATTIR